MYLGRHCNKNDYLYLERISKEFLILINRDNYDIELTKSYLKAFSDFDFEISTKICIYLDKISIDKDKYLNKIVALLEELKTNVLVDIREHN